MLPDFKCLLESAPDLVIVAASDAYLNATMTKRNDIVGRYVFDVFPDDPDDPASNRLQTVRASIEQAIQTATPVAMAVQRYSIRRPHTGGSGFRAQLARHVSRQGSTAPVDPPKPSPPKGR